MDGVVLLLLNAKGFTDRLFVTICRTGLPKVVSSANCLVKLFYLFSPSRSAC